ncbi:MAG: MerR family transcriptional regulator [Anaerolineae bacterium]|nr:MerR family transcriptional regulator [Anaerolineae bacterium]
MNDIKSNDSQFPVYNIKAAARLTGLLPVTLRAWERRYEIPTPQRGSQGYRLYSDHDIRILRWLKQQVNSGMSISRAVEYLRELRSQDQDPTQIETKDEISRAPSAALSTSAMELEHALVRFDENFASSVLQQASNLHPLDQVLTGVIEPCLVAIGAAWQRGELAVAVEHFATQFVMKYLMMLVSGFAPPTHNDVIIAACAPGETHQVGLMMLTTLLRWRSWDVLYLGADLTLENLETALRPLRPRMLLFSATRQQNAENMFGLEKIIQGFSKPSPIVVLGGHGFDAMDLASLPAIYLDMPVDQAVRRIEGMLLSN